MRGSFLVVLSIALAAGCTSGRPPEPAPVAASHATKADDWGIPKSAERFEIRKAIVLEKLDTAVLPAMRAHNIDMWIVLDRENHPEPLHEEVGGGFSGVRGAYIFFDNGAAKPEKIYFGSHEQASNSVVGQVYDVKQYYGYSKEGLTPLLREAVQKRKPKKIGVNTSATLPEADGLTVGLKDFLVTAIGPEYAKNITSAELVVRDFRTTRTPLETKLYKQLLAWTARWEEGALSDANVIVGKTSAVDIAWHLQDTALSMGLTGEGTPRVVRNGDLLPLNAPDITIQPGDIISIDGGMQMLGYHTDIKRAAYVLKPGETEPPKSIQEAWQTTVHTIGDLYASRMKPGAVGHEVWKALMDDTTKLGYEVAYPDAGGRAATTSKAEVGVYGHSTGNDAHDIGARIAQDWPFAYGDRVRFPLRQGEWASLEFHVSTPIPEWGGKTWYARHEETAQIGSNGAEWMIPRQEKLLLIHSGAAAR